MRILVVEDSRTQAKQLRLYLESAGYSVEIAEDAERALDRFHNSRFDLLISDIVMPGMDGLELCRQIKAMKADPERAQTPVILLTANDSDQAIVDGFDAGADEYVTKSNSSTVLLARVRSVLRAKTAQDLLCAATARDNAEQRRRHGQTTRHNALLGGINHVFEMALTCESDAELANECLKVAEQLTGSKFGFIGELNGADRLDTISISDPGWDACRIDRTKVAKDIRDMVVRSIWGRVIKDGKALITNDPLGHPDRVGVPQGHPPITAFLGVPLKRGGKTIGIIALGNKESGYDEGDQKMTEALGTAFVEVLMRKRTEKALRESERVQRLLMESINVGVVVVDSRTHVIEYANRAATMLFEAPADQIVGHECHCFLCPAEKGCCPITDRGQDVDNADRVMLGAGGRRVPVLKSVRRIEIAGEEKLIETFVDITERNRAEDALRKANASLVQLNQELTVAAGQIKALMEMVISTAKTAERFTNPFLIRCWERKGCTQSACPAFGRDDNLRCWAITATCCNGEIQETLIQKRRTCANCDVYQAARSNPIGEMGEAFNEMLAILGSRESALEEARAAAEAASRAKSEFLANMSHEIRTPMTSILGYTDLLMDDSLSPADRERYLMTVRRNGEHLLQLINDILDLAKIEAGKMVVDLSACHLPSTISDVASMMRPRAQQRRSTLEVRYAGPLPETIHTDGNRLRQVLVNLVGNAVKFTEQGNIQIAVAFLPDWRPDQAAVRVDVTDTGIGIREEVLRRLFTPFTQAETSTTRKYGGTGLGLAISREIVSMLGGELTVSSKFGEGSIFSVTLPTGDISGVAWLHSPAEAVCDGVAASQWQPNAGALHGVKILLAEDSFDNQTLIKAVLGRTGADVDVVENGSLAVARAENGNFDVILMDMNMPEMDGYEATRTLRDRGYQRPILALTANAMSGDAERCLAVGCNAHLAKPIDRKQLIESVARYAVRRTGAAEASLSNPGCMESAAQRDAIVSQFADDPQLADILPGFVERLPGQLEAIGEALRKEDLAEVQRLAHRLAGAGGSYGYPRLTEVARSLEFKAKERDPAETTEALARVEEICAAIQAGWKSRTQEAVQL